MGQFPFPLIRLTSRGILLSHDSGGASICDFDSSLHIPYNLQYSAFVDSYVLSSCY